MAGLDSDLVSRLQETLRCIICRSTLRDAHLCPHCSAIGCHRCLTTWLKGQSSCPQCRKALSVDTIVRCRSLDDATQAFADLIHQVHTSGGAIDSDIDLDDLAASGQGELCAEHDKSLEVYCKTCQECICSACALWGSHKSHDHVDIDDIWQTHVDNISAKLHGLKDQQSKLLGRMQKIEQRVDAVQTLQRDALNHVAEQGRYLANDIEARAAEKLNTLLGYKERLSSQTSQLEGLLLEIERPLRSRSKSLLIRCSRELEDKYYKAMREEEPRAAAALMTEPLSPSLFTLGSLLPPEHTMTFTIPDFLATAATSQPGQLMYSQPLNIMGAEFALKIYPAAASTAVRRYFSVFVEMRSGPDASTLGVALRMAWSIELVPPRPRDSLHQIRRKGVSVFTVGECWGFDKFYFVQELERVGLITAENKDLTLKLCMRCHDYQVCHALAQTQVDMLARKVTELQTTRSEAEQRCRNLEHQLALQQQPQRHTSTPAARLPLPPSTPFRDHPVIAPAATSALAGLSKATLQLIQDKTRQAMPLSSSPPQRDAIHVEQQAHGSPRLKTQLLAASSPPHSTQHLTDTDRSRYHHEHTQHAATLPLQMQELDSPPHQPLELPTLATLSQYPHTPRSRKAADSHANLQMMQSGAALQAPSSSGGNQQHLSALPALQDRQDKHAKLGEHPSRPGSPLQLRDLDGSPAVTPDRGADKASRRLDTWTVDSQEWLQSMQHSLRQLPLVSDQQASNS
eukprot:TRINITY_DN12391_c2_g1_i3.p1 TRINITY_DN12391_c2_g1~~TRINITY_DN12391_c2_g1_i3.p1  ORF type:complete len:741 (+),score=142.34 TRINITY_DN12391_c2_g1_i3:2-2224(+)